MYGKIVFRCRKRLESVVSTGYQAAKYETNVDLVYRKHLSILDHIVNYQGKTKWDDFLDKEKKTVENTVLLVGVLYKMCQVNLVLKQENKDGLNKVNKEAVNSTIRDSETVLRDVKNAI